MTSLENNASPLRDESQLNYGAILDALDGLSNDVKPDTEHLAKLIRQFGRQIGHCETDDFAIEAEVRSLRSQDRSRRSEEAAMERILADQLKRPRPISIPVGQPIASDVVAAPDAKLVGYMHTMHTEGCNLICLSTDTENPWGKRNLNYGDHDVTCEPLWVFRGLKPGEGLEGDAATSPDVLSRQSPVEGDKK